MVTPRSSRQTGGKGTRAYGLRRPGLGIGLIALGIALAANSILGPLATGVIRYHYSEALIRQGIAIDAVSLLLVAPLAGGVGLLALRGHPAAPVLALGPALYTAYTSVQYAIGPEYLLLPGNNERFLPLHLGLFVLAAAIGIRAWTAIDPTRLPPTSRRERRRLGILLLGLGVLLLLRYLPILAELVRGEPTLPGYRENPTSFLLIAWMDIGIFLPAALAGGAGLWHGQAWGKKALYAIVGWFALVALAVAGMAVLMTLEGDPAASVGLTVVVVILATLAGGLAGWLYWPLRG